VAIAIRWLALRCAAAALTLSPAVCGAKATFAPAKPDAIEAALAKSWAQSRAPGVIVGIWIPGEGRRQDLPPTRAEADGVAKFRRSERAG
jgi:hypothetical protein